jgi:hypothetical protein
VGVANGGTGQTTYTNGQLLIGNSTGNTLTKAVLTAGTGISISNGAGSITIATTGGSSGTVTSVDVSGGTTGLTFSGGPVTASGTITMAGKLAGANGGTNSNFFEVTGPTTSLKTFTFPNASATVLTTNALVTVAQGGTGTNTSTGSGSVVLATSPTLVTPVLGTPTSGTLSSCTVDGTNAVGFKNIPQTTSTTLAATSVGKHHYVSAGVTINTGVFSAGDAFMIVNSGTSSITITQGTSVTLRLAGTATTGSRTLAQKGVASILCVAAGDFIVSGAGVT